MRSWTGVVLTTGVAAALLTAPAAAQTPTATYAATAGARALSLQIAGTTLVGGDSASSLDSTTVARGAGAGALTPGLTGSAVAESPSAGANVLVAETCSPLVIADPNLPLSAATACGEAAAETEGDPTSSSSGYVEDLALQIEGTPFDEPIGQVVEPLGSGLDQLFAALRPILDPLGEETGIEPDVLLSDLLDEIANGTPAARIQLGAARSTATVTPEAVSSTASAEGGTLSILGLLDVIVGPSSASVSWSRVDGSVTHAEQAAAISLKLTGILSLIPDPEDGSTLGEALKPLFEGLGDSPDDGEVILDLLTAEQLAALQEAGLFDANGCLNPGEQFPAPLNTLLCVELASASFVNEGGTATSRATAVNVRLLDGVVPDGGVRLALSESTASVAGLTEVLAAAPAEPQTPLARTGGDSTAMGWLALAFAAGLAGVVLVRRSSSPG